VAGKYERIVGSLRRYADASIYCGSRKNLFTLTREARRKLHGELTQTFKEDPEFARDLGLDASLDSFEVHGLHRASRTSQDGRPVPQLIVALTQSRMVPPPDGTGGAGFIMRGGSTLVVDLAARRVKYRIFKNVNSAAREARTAAFAAANAADPLRQLMFGNHDEPFAALHSLVEAEE
jgi:hypothetical protein